MADLAEGSSRSEPVMSGPIGFVGLGVMGGPMAANLAAAGLPVTVFDVDAGACARLSGRPGVVVAGSPAEVAASSRVVVNFMPRADFARMVKDEFANYARILRDLGVKAE